MNMKCCVMVSVFALASISATQAASAIVLKQKTPVTVFSWVGFYLSGQIMKDFLSQMDINTQYKKKSSVQFSGDFLSEPVGFMGGLYAGSNLAFNNGFVLGIETDIIVSNSKTIQRSGYEITTTNELNYLNDIFEKYGVTYEDSLAPRIGDENIGHVILKEKWMGATRARIGFSYGRVMPYIAGGISYTQFQAITSISIEKQNTGKIAAFGDLSNEVKTMVGFTIGGGFDYAIIDNVILRAEYRYSDFGQKKFAKNHYILDNKISDLRIGIAYKF
ncbi:outer membrane protein [Bartonella sp. F02]|uniref:outer membrane protein n=1 Tax=Bartonella sp. F02 TaxID=2967262 RepID=UPI0022A97092|nr:outer membrane protein [Bartonella sp. F02]MCZ2328095.1 porin family protein [Bartonella sp. F02]